MHELSPSNSKGFRGPLGFIEFTTAMRLPRHIHMTPDRARLLDERILVLAGVGMVELAGEYYVIAPGSLVDIPGGVPHTWTACPEGVRLPGKGGEVSRGRFTMVYEYEEPTTFFPMAETGPVRSPEEYRILEEGGGFGSEGVRFPEMSKMEVVQLAKCVIDREVGELSLA